MSDDVLILFPGALGDFLCLWPTLQALRARNKGRVTVVARSEIACLLPRDRIDFLSIDRREIADLYAAGPLAGETRALLAGFSRVESWTGSNTPQIAQRLAAATGGRVSIHAFRGMRAGEHAAAYYARCADVQLDDGPLVPSADARAWARSFLAPQLAQRRVLVMHAGSGGRPKNWEGMAEVARWWATSPQGAVLALVGPAEVDPNATAGANAVLRNAPLDRVAAVIAAATAFVGNDSGISHLAGLVGTRGAVLFAATDPATWRPRGPGLHVLHAPVPCSQCGPARFCVHRLTVASVCNTLRPLASSA